MSRTGEMTSSSSLPRYGASMAIPSSAAAADRVAAEACGLDRAEQLLDAARLSELLDRQVTITHVRSKPGRSLAVAHTGLDGEAGWTTLTLDGVKLHKAQERAASFNTELKVHSASGHYLFSGSVWGDPQLAKELSAARAALGEDVNWHVLRYNPRRRVVATVRTGSGHQVVRVLANGADRLRHTARHWREMGIPVTKVAALGDRCSATIAPLWGVNDLSREPHPPAAETAGAAVGRLHSMPARPAGRRYAPPDPGSAADGLADIAPWAAHRAARLAERLERLMAQLPALTPAEIHGDLSPDQVVLAAAGSHKIRLIDLDRAGSGDPMRDVGSWVAACRRDQQPDMIDAFLTGYRTQARLRLSEVDVWEAYAHLAGAPDFFRHREPDWPARTVRALDLTEEALNR